MKARALTISFQSASAGNVATLRKFASEDVAAVVSYAMDFRKVCPPQAPGVEGGYSEAEILEIEALVVSQCEEAKKVAGTPKRAKITVTASPRGTDTEPTAVAKRTSPPSATAKGSSTHQAWRSGITGVTGKVPDSRL